MAPASETRRKARNSSNNGGGPERNGGSPPRSSGGLDDMLADAATSPIRRWFPGVAAAKVGAKIASRALWH